MNSKDKNYRVIEDDEGNYIGQSINASEESVELVINADVSDNDGRSTWKWFRLSNGDLILGCYPRGDVYEETELDWEM